MKWKLPLEKEKVLVGGQKVMLIDWEGVAIAEFSSDYVSTSMYNPSTLPQFLAGAYSS